MSQKALPRVVVQHGPDVHYMFERASWREAFADGIRIARESAHSYGKPLTHGWRTDGTYVAGSFTVSAVEVSS